jgi:hypothetical protein
VRDRQYKGSGERKKEKGKTSGGEEAFFIDRGEVRTMDEAIVAYQTKCSSLCLG